MKVVVSLLKSLGKRMQSKNLQVVLAVPPARGYVRELVLFSVNSGFENVYSKYK